MEKPGSSSKNSSISVCQVMMIAIFTAYTRARRINDLFRINERFPAACMHKKHVLIRDRSHVKCTQDEVNNYGENTVGSKVGSRLSTPQNDVLIDAAESDGAVAGGACQNAKQVQPQPQSIIATEYISLGCTRTGNVSDAAKTTRPIPASSHSRVGMSPGCRMIQVPINQPAPQPRP